MMAACCMHIFGAIQALIGNVYAAEEAIIKMREELLGLSGLGFSRGGESCKMRYFERGGGWTVGGRGE